MSRSRDTRREFLRTLARGGALTLLAGGLWHLATGQRDRPCTGCSPRACTEEGCRFREPRKPV